MCGNTQQNKVCITLNKDYGTDRQSRYSGRD